MTEFKGLVRRNTRLFFKDKGMFFTSLITPMILLVLYGTFLGKVYKDSFLSSMPAMVSLPEKLVDGFVGGQLISSILAVSCVTVAFCSNMLMVQDKVSGAYRDLTISPVKASTLALSYYFSTFIVTMIICLAGAALCLGYVAIVGWYMSLGDVLLLIGDIFLLVLFGTALSSIINFFLSTQGQISAVGTIISAVYGFICGAYMPISQFSEGLQKVILMLPGTYGTALLRNHAMAGAFREMGKLGIPETALDSLRKAVDCRLDFFGTEVETPALYLVLGGTVLVLILIYVLMNAVRGKKAKK